jgi:hypothetical protein
MSIGRARGAVVLVVMLGIAVPCHGEIKTPSTARESGRVGLLESAARIAVGSRVKLERAAPAQSQRRQNDRRSVKRVILGAAAGAAGGFFAGGYIGAAIDGDCGGCDDPGFKGFLIGAPIGAVAGGIAGGKWLF